MRSISCFTVLLLLILPGCKKDIPPTGKLASGVVSDYSSDGVLTVQVSIFPPVTPQTFIPNAPGGNASFTAYDLIASKLVYIDDFSVKASYPSIFIIGGVPNTHTETAIPINTQMFSSQPHTIPIGILYKNVDATTTPTITTCRLKAVHYHTSDFISHTLTVDKISGSAFSMCLVNNVAHMKFQNPARYKVLDNGYVEIAEIVLTGDTGWTLKSLPLNYYFSDFSEGNYPTKIVAKCNGTSVGVATILSGHSATICFKPGFKHVAGRSEILKIYGDHISLNRGGFFITEMGDLNGLIWKDGLGGLISGDLNAQFYKEQNGSSSLHNL